MLIHDSVEAIALAIDNIDRMFGGMKGNRVRKCRLGPSWSIFPLLCSKRFMTIR